MIIKGIIKLTDAFNITWRKTIRIKAIFCEGFYLSFQHKIDLSGVKYLSLVLWSFNTFCERKLKIKVNLIHAWKGALYHVSRI